LILHANVYYVVLPKSLSFEYMYIQQQMFSYWS